MQIHAQLVRKEINHAIGTHVPHKELESAQGILLPPSLFNIVAYSFHTPNKYTLKNIGTSRCGYIGLNFLERENRILTSLGRASAFLRV